MRRSLPLLIAVPLLCVAAARAAQQPEMVPPPPQPQQRASLANPSVPTQWPVWIETSLATDGQQIRQFAFDGNPETFFASTPGVKPEDHFTLVLENPVTVKSVAVTTGRPDGAGRLENGALQLSADGTTFTDAATFADGTASAEPGEQRVQAIRLQPRAESAGPLVVRAFTLDAEPAVRPFPYPVEIAIDISDSPQMKEWAEATARICERAYPMLNEELKSEGFTPRTLIQMRITTTYGGVAAAGGGRMTGSTAFFTRNPRDVGAMLHETAHIVQAYGGRRGNPGWLVEGMADFVRYYVFENPRRINPDRARYNGSYGTTAAFLNYVREKYDPQLTLKLNAAMRRGEYSEELWQQYTGKTVQELDEEWRASLRGGQ